MSVQVVPPSAESPLRALAAGLEAAVKRAQIAKADADQQQTFVRLHKEVRRGRDALDTARFLLRTPELAVTDGEERAVREELANVAKTLIALRDALRLDPAGVREGKVWITFKRALGKLATVSDDVRQNAVTRLAASAPQPRPGIDVALPPGDELAERYRRLTERYRQCAEKLDDADAVRTFCALCEKLAKVEAEIDARAVPPEHVDTWRHLLDGTLRLNELPPAFLDWLRAEGHEAHVVLAYSNA